VAICGVGAARHIRRIRQRRVSRLHRCWQSGPSGSPSPRSEFFISRFDHDRRDESVSDARERECRREEPLLCVEELEGDRGDLADEGEDAAARLLDAGARRREIAVLRDRLGDEGVTLRNLEELPPWEVGDAGGSPVRDATRCWSPR
jgi:hypothetical protein